jgi:ADP-ribosyl-[dinitrogen reductase] hydrolase
MNISKNDRFRGCLLGLAAGDALGTTLEFKPPGSFDPSVDMVGGGPFGLKPGQWTDDTSMALCLATSLLECDGFDPSDQMQRYVRWWREGYLSPTGTCFDIGMTIRNALSRFMKDGEAFTGSTDPMTAGNGSLMRLAPVPMFYADSPAEAKRRSAESSLTTHAAPEAVDACRFFAGLLLGALEGVDRDTLLSPEYWHRDEDSNGPEMSPKIAAIAQGSFKHKEPPEIQGTGYVVPALEAALWAFHRSTNFRDGALLAVNLGDDADTTGAIYGQLAGAYYGSESIPESWRDKLAMKAEIVSLADRMYQHSHSTGTV